MSMLLIRFLGLFGISLGPVLASFIMWGAAAIGVLVWYNHELSQAEERGRISCENEVKRVTAEETARIESANDKVRKKDDEIRVILERRNDEINKAVADAIKQTAVNRRVCWDRDTIRNINRVR